MKKQQTNSHKFEKERKWDERDGWLRDDNFYDISYFFIIFLSIVEKREEEMVEMRRMTLERIKEEVLIKRKRRNKSHFISLS